MNAAESAPGCQQSQQELWQLVGRCKGINFRAGPEQSRCQQQLYETGNLVQPEDEKDEEGGANQMRSAGHRRSYQVASKQRPGQ